MADVTQEDINNMVRDIAGIKKTVDDFNVPDLSGFASKSDVEACVGDHCKKIEGKISTNSTRLAAMEAGMKHVDAGIHSLKPSRVKQPGPGEQPKQHQHGNWGEAADCVDCYPEIEKVVMPKIQEKMKLQPIVLPDDVKAVIKASKAQHCTECCYPWQDPAVDKCTNCGAGA